MSLTGSPPCARAAKAPESLLTGCNTFLRSLDVTFRRDPKSYRPRINKFGSQMDQEQKLSGNYVCELRALRAALTLQFFLEDES